MGIFSKIRALLKGDKPRSEATEQIEERLLAAFGYAGESQQNQSEFLGQALARLERGLAGLAADLRLSQDVEWAALTVPENAAPTPLVIELKLTENGRRSVARIKEHATEAMTRALGQAGVVGVSVVEAASAGKPFFQHGPTGNAKS